MTTSKPIRQLIAERVPALTIRQPWASLIVDGVKDVENRTWRTRYRGLMLVHAGSGRDAEGIRTYGHLVKDLTPGAILGLVHLDDIVENDPSPWALPGNLHWKLSRAERFDEPKFCSGKLGLWRPSLADLLDPPSPV